MSDSSNRRMNDKTNSVYGDISVIYIDSPFSRNLEVCHVYLNLCFIRLIHRMIQKLQARVQTLMIEVSPIESNQAKFNLPHHSRESLPPQDLTQEAEEP
jgi:hypothetical protein